MARGLLLDSRPLGKPGVDLAEDQTEMRPRITIIWLPDLSK